MLMLIFRARTILMLVVLVAVPLLLTACGKGGGY